jgi:hypothetical protein
MVKGGKVSVTVGPGSQATMNEGPARSLCRRQPADPHHGGGVDGTCIEANAIGAGFMLTEMDEGLINKEAFRPCVLRRIPALVVQAGKTDWHNRITGAFSFRLRQWQIMYVDGGMLAVL